MRRSVLDAVLSCLDDGTSPVSIPEIAARAQVAPSSLYRRWGTWQNLAAEALLEESRTAIPIPDTGSVRDDLVEFAQSLATLLRTRRGTALVRTLASLEPTADLAAARARFWDERLTLASVMVERGIERGELPAGTDARRLVEMLVAPLHVRLLLLGVDPGTGIIEQVDLLLDGSRRTP